MRTEQGRARWISEHTMERLSAYEHIMGTMSDIKVAEVAGMGKSVVQAYRSHMGIPAFKRIPKVPPKERFEERIEREAAEAEKLFQGWGRSNELIRAVCYLQKREKRRRLLSYVTQAVERL